MPDRSGILTRAGDSIRLSVLVQPKAARDEWAGLHDGRVRIRVKAPPVDGKANKRLIDFLARQFGVPKSRVSVVSGQSGRRKVVRVDGADELPVPLLACLEQAS